MANGTTGFHEHLSFQSYPGNETIGAKIFFIVDIILQPGFNGVFPFE